MCLIVAKVKPDSPIIKEEYLKNGYESNDDSIGFAAVDNNQLIVQKFLKYDEFRNAVEPYMDKILVVHFRAASFNMDVNLENCHPFLIDGSSVFVHNGRFQNCITNYKLSDTNNFNENIIKPLSKQYPKWWLNTGLVWLLEKSIGDNNKLVFLNNECEYKIINEDKGIWHENLWMSNEFFRTPRAKNQSAEGLYGKNYNNSTYTNGKWEKQDWDKWHAEQDKKFKDKESQGTTSDDNNPLGGGGDETITLEDLAAVDDYLDQLNSVSTK